jgi:hypothetical protein
MRTVVVLCFLLGGVAFVEVGLMVPSRWCLGCCLKELINVAELSFLFVIFFFECVHS